MILVVLAVVLVIILGVLAVVLVMILGVLAVVLVQTFQKVRIHLVALGLLLLVPMVWEFHIEYGNENQKLWVYEGRMVASVILISRKARKKNITLEE